MSSAYYEAGNMWFEPMLIMSGSSKFAVIGISIELLYADLAQAKSILEYHND